jgi:hypothetical protein
VGRPVELRAEHGLTSLGFAAVVVALARLPIVDATPEMGAMVDAAACGTEFPTSFSLWQAIFAARLVKRLCAPRAQRLFEFDENKVRALGLPDTGIVIGKRFDDPRPRITLTFVPCDQGLTLLDHCQPHHTGARRFGAGLSLGEQSFAETGRLQSRAHRQHAEIETLGVHALQPDTGKDASSLSLAHRQHCRTRFGGEVRRKARRVDPLAAQKIGLGRPTRSRSVAAIKDKMGALLAGQTRCLEGTRIANRR